MTISNKTSKAGLATFLEKTLTDGKIVFQDSSLVEMMEYTVKKYKENKREVLKSDLLELALEVRDYVLPTQETLIPTENAIKTISKVKNEATEEPTSDENTKEIEEPKESTKEPKKSNKSLKKQDETKEEPKKPKAKKSVKAVPPQTVEVVELPDTIETELGRLTKVSNLVSVKEFAKAVDEGRNLYLAESWSKKAIKQFNYDYTGVLDKVKEFPNDLDLLQPILITENKAVVYAISIYTEKMGYFRDAEFEVVEDVRYVNFAEWSIYELEDLEAINEVDEESVKELEAEEELDTKKVSKK